MTKPKKKEARSRGSIIERAKDTFLIRIYLGTDGKGCRRYINETVRGKRTDANKRLTELLHQADTNQIIETSKTTVGDYLKQWLATTAKSRVIEQTFYSYEQLVDNHLIQRIGNLRLTNLRHIDVQQLHDKMTVEGIGSSTVRHCHSVLHAALADALRLNLLAVNPATAAKLPKHIRQELTVLNADQAKSFLEAARTTPQSCLFHLALETGMRREEYLGLKWSDIDLQNHTVSIIRALKSRKKTEASSWYFGKLKTKKSRRTISLSTNLVNSLKKQRREKN